MALFGFFDMGLKHFEFNFSRNTFFFVAFGVIIAASQIARDRKVLQSILSCVHILLEFSCFTALYFKLPQEK